MSGGFFRGTSADQDTRFSNKQAKLLKTQKFPAELEQLVDITKVKMDVIRPWIATRVTELLGFEDEVLINFIYGLLDGKEVNGKEVQIQLTGFMEKNTGKFMKELWILLLSAQKNASGVPQQLLDAKAEEIRKKKAETDFLASEIQKRREKESREVEEQRLKKMDDGTEKVTIAALEPNSKNARLRSMRNHSDDEGDTERRNGVRGRSRDSRSPRLATHSPSPRRSPSRSLSQPFSNSRSYSDDRHKSRSMSRSPRHRGRSFSRGRLSHSSPRPSLSPHHRGRDDSFSPRNKLPYSRKRSRSTSHRKSLSPSPSQHGSPPHRKSSPIHQRRLSLLEHRRSPPHVRHRRSPTPERRRRSPSPRRWRRSPSLERRRRSPSPRRRRRSPSPGWRHRSPSPLRRRRSPSPKQRRRSPSPLCRRKSPLTHRRGSPSPSRRRRSPSPSRRRRSPSPSRRRRSPSPARRRLSPVHRRRSPSPMQRQRSRSPMQQHTSPSTSPVQQFNGSSLPIRRHKSPTPLSKSPLVAERLSPIREMKSLTPPHRRSISPYDSSSSSMERETPSHVKRKSAQHQRFPIQSPRGRTRNIQTTVDPVRSPLKDAREQNNPNNRIHASSLSEKSPAPAESPPMSRSVSDDRRFGSPRSREKQHNRGNHSTIQREDDTIYARDAGNLEPRSSLKRSVNSSIVGKIKDHSPDGVSHKPSSPESEKHHTQRRSLGTSEKRQSLLSHKETLLVEEHQPSEKSPSHLNKVKESSFHESDSVAVADKKGNNNQSGTLDSDSEEGYRRKSGSKEKKRHRRSDKRETSSDSDDSYDTELERKEAKKRKKEERRLRKEKKRQKREERRRKKEERRAEKIKSKNLSDVDSEDDGRVTKGESKSSDGGEDESEHRKKLEIELRKKALESFNARKGTRH